MNFIIINSLFILLITLWLIKWRSKVRELQENANYHNVVYQELAKQCGGFFAYKNIEDDYPIFVKYDDISKNEE